MATGQSDLNNSSGKDPSQVTKAVSSWQLKLTIAEC